LASLFFYLLIYFSINFSSDVTVTLIGWCLFYYLDGWC